MRDPDDLPAPSRAGRTDPPGAKTKRIPAPTILAVRELLRPYMPLLDEMEIQRRLTAPLSREPAAAPERMLTDLEVAAILGCCRATVHNLMREEQLPRIKIRRMTRIPESSVRALMAGRQAPSPDTPTDNPPF